MSKLDELISVLCPDGVPYKYLSECCSLEKGKTPIQKAIPGEYPLVVTTAERKTSNDYQFDGAAVCIPLVSSRGHGVACLNAVYYQEGKFALGNILCGVTPHDNSGLSAKFLYYYLNLKKDTLIVPLMKGGANVSLTVNSLKTIKMPIPPLEVQMEVIRLVDKFEELISALESELEERWLQYEYYRNSLFEFRDDIEVVTLKDICKKICSGGTPKSTNKEYYDGDIPWLRTQEVDWDDIYDTGVKITQKGLDNSSAKWIPANCLIIAMYGATAAKVAINRIPLTTNQACCNLEIDESKADLRYVFHWMSREYLKLKDMGQGSQSNINAVIVKNYPIPLPSIEEQKRISDVLDKWHSLVKSTEIGIPAEIEARKIQYEYYRNTLLQFKEKI